MEIPVRELRVFLELLQVPFISNETVIFCCCWVSQMAGPILTSRGGHRKLLLLRNGFPNLVRTHQLTSLAKYPKRDQISIDITSVVNLGDSTSLRPPTSRFHKRFEEAGVLPRSLLIVLINFAGSLEAGLLRCRQVSKLVVNWQRQHKAIPSNL
jgi:hypothetical protein